MKEKHSNKTVWVFYQKMILIRAVLCWRCLMVFRLLQKKKKNNRFTGLMVAQKHRKRVSLLFLCSWSLSIAWKKFGLTQKEFCSKNYYRIFRNRTINIDIFRHSLFSVFSYMCYFHFSKWNLHIKKYTKWIRRVTHSYLYFLSILEGKYVEKYSIKLDILVLHTKIRTDVTYTIAIIMFFFP